MGDNKLKEGVSIKEIEEFAKKNRFDVFLCVLFFIACVFAFALWGTGWCVVAAFIGTIVGILSSNQIEGLSKKGVLFLLKQESTTQIVLAVVLLVFAVILPLLYFFILGAHGGKSLHKLTSDTTSS